MKAKSSALIQVAVTLLILACPLARGQSADLDVPVNLADYLTMAAANNAELKAELESYKAAIEEIPQAKTLSDPQLSYGYATRPTPQRSVFEVMQTFPWFGTIDARTDAASAIAKSTGRQYEAKKLVVYYEVKQAFYEFSFLAKATAIARENLQLMRHFEEVARTKYATSTATHPDVIRARIELVTLEDDLITFTKRRSAVTAKLNSLLNRPAESELPWPKSPVYHEMLTDFKQVNELIVRNNPELQGAAYEIEAARSKEKLAQKKSYPEFGIGVAVDAGMGRDDSSRTMPIVQMTLPIWGNNYKAAERQAKAQLMQATHQKVQMENTLAARGQQVLFELQDSERKIRLYKDAIIPKVREMIAASESAYQAGSLDFLSLIDAQRTLLKYQLEYERAAADNGQRQAELEMLMGTEFPER